MGMQLYQVTSEMETLRINLGDGEEIALPILPCYSNVVRAASPQDAANIGFFHARENNRDFNKVYITLLCEPDDGQPGVCRETAYSWVCHQGQEVNPA